jgi:cysteine-rich repeat protein
MTLAFAALALVAIGAGTAGAAGGCLDGKLKALGKKEASLLKCQAKNAAKPDTVKLGECEAKASGKFGPACSAAGVCSGDCTTCENLADACESNVSAAITDAAKLKAASKLTKGELKCYTKAAAKGEAVDTVKCLPKAQSKFGAAGGTAGEQNTVETNCVDNVVTTDGGGSPPTGNVTAICGAAGATTTTTTAGSTTTTNPHVCGNGTIEGPFETCDDHNMVDETTVDTIPPDACPANCRIEPCTSTSGTLSVSVNFSSPSSVAGYKIFVDYPEGKVIIPGNGQPAAGVITNDPTNTATANDLDYGMIVVVGGLNAIPPPRLFTISFTPCSGPSPTAAEFHCKVHQASDTGGNDIPMTCSVSIP